MTSGQMSLIFSETCKGRTSKTLMDCLLLTEINSGSERK